MSKRTHDEMTKNGDGAVADNASPAKRAATGAAGMDPPAWVVQDDMIYRAGGTPSARVVGFDMDGTLIKTKSGRAFPVNVDDWELRFPAQLKAKMAELHADGVHVMIVTNQLGIVKGKITKEDVMAKIDALATEMGVPLSALVCVSTGKFRKPSPHIAEYMAKVNNGVKMNAAQSAYVGDAAGRAKAWDGNKKTKKDFSASDRKFAHNLGFAFATPEEYFLKQDAAPFEWHTVDPHTIARASESEEAMQLHRSKQEMVVMVGQPAAGKSTFSARYFGEHGYVVVNRDTLRTQAKCKKAAGEALASGKSVVIDNTNNNKTARADYIALAKKNKVPVRCVWLKTPRDIAEHLNMYRELNGGKEHVPRVAIATYYKRFEEPAASEGFSEVIEMPFRASFATQQDEKLFNKWS